MNDVRVRYVELWPVFVVAVVSAGIGLLRALPRVRVGDVRSSLQVACSALLVGAVVAILWVTLAPPGWGVRSVNLTPGQGIRGALSNINEGLGRLNILGNVAMFVPVGSLARLSLRRSVGAVTLFGAGLSVVIEAAQYALGRAADIDDVLLNSTGALLGALAASRLLRLGT